MITVHAVGTRFGKEGVGYNEVSKRFLHQKNERNPLLGSDFWELPPLRSKLNFLGLFTVYLVENTALLANNLINI